MSLPGTGVIATETIVKLKRNVSQECIASIINTEKKMLSTLFSIKLKYYTEHV